MIFDSSSSTTGRVFFVIFWTANIIFSKLVEAGSTNGRFQEKTSRKPSGKHKQKDWHEHPQVTSMWINKSNSILFYIQRLKRLHRKQNQAAQKWQLNRNHRVWWKFPCGKSSPRPPHRQLHSLGTNTQGQSLRAKTAGEGEKVSAAIPAASKGFIFPAPGVSPQAQPHQELPNLARSSSADTPGLVASTSIYNEVESSWF